MFTALFARQHEKVSPCLEEVAEPAGWKLRVWTANTDEAEEGVWRDRYSLWSFCRFGLLCACLKRAHQKLCFYSSTLWTGTLARQSNSRHGPLIDLMTEDLHTTA